MPSFSSTLEAAIHNALGQANAAQARACDARASPSRADRRTGRGAGDEGLRRRSRQAAQDHRRLPRRGARRADLRHRGLRGGADHRLPAGDPARGDPRAELGPLRGDRRQRAGRDLRRTREPCRLFPAGAGHDPLRRGQLHQPRRRQGSVLWRGPSGEGCRGSARDEGTGPGGQGSRGDRVAEILRRPEREGTPGATSIR